MRDKALKIYNLYRKILNLVKISIVITFDQNSLKS